MEAGRISLWRESLHGDWREGGRGGEGRGGEGREGGREGGEEGSVSNKQNSNPFTHTHTCSKSLVRNMHMPTHVASSKF